MYCNADHIQLIICKSSAYIRDAPRLDLKRSICRQFLQDLDLEHHYSLFQSIQHGPIQVLTYAGEDYIVYFATFCPAKRVLEQGKWMSISCQHQLIQRIKGRMPASYLNYIYGGIFAAIMIGEETETDEEKDEELKWQTLLEDNNAELQTQLQATQNKLDELKEQIKKSNTRTNRNERRAQEMKIRQISRHYYQQPGSVAQQFWHVSQDLNISPELKYRIIKLGMYLSVDQRDEFSQIEQILEAESQSQVEIVISARLQEIWERFAKYVHQHPQLQVEREIKFEPWKNGGPIIGIANIGNTCFSNALHQLLFSIPELRFSNMRLQMDSNIMRNPNLIRYTLHGMSETREGQVFTPEVAIVALPYIQCFRSIGQQHDPEELLRKALFQPIADHLPEIASNGSLTAYLHLAHYRDWLNLFVYLERNVRMCLDDGKEEFYLDQPRITTVFKLNLAPALNETQRLFSIQELYQEEFRPVGIPLSRQATVPGCHLRAGFTFKYNFGPYLIVQVGRLDYQVKFITPIEANEILTVWGDLNYELVGIVYHTGEDKSIGHYVYFKRLDDKTWILLDDNTWKLGLIEPRYTGYGDHNVNAQQYGYLYLYRRI